MEHPPIPENFTLGESLGVNWMGPPLEKSKEVVVLGLGLIGGSFAKTLLQRGWSVAGFDPDSNARRHAAAVGIEVFEFLEDLEGRSPGLVVIAGPLWTIVESAELISRLTSEDCLVAEFGSVKGSVVSSLQELPTAFKKRFFPLHPMAGKESSGFENSDDSLLVGAPWALVETEEQLDVNLGRIITFLTSEFSARVFPVTGPNHDLAVALISQLPHLLANMLLAAVGESNSRRLAFGLSAGSFRDGTRVAGTAPGRTSAMISENSQNLYEIAARLGAELISSSADLKAGRDLGVFDRAGTARVMFDEYLLARRTTQESQMPWGNFRPWFKGILDSGGSISSLNISEGIASVGFSE
jgi:prephenate dehydrogenase